MGRSGVSSSKQVPTEAEKAPDTPQVNPNQALIDTLTAARLQAPTAGIKAALTTRIRKLGGTVGGSTKSGGNSVDNFLAELEAQAAQAQAEHDSQTDTEKVSA